jgi:hypothetical protein
VTPLRQPLLACELVVSRGGAAGAVALRVPRPRPPAALPILRSLRYHLDDGATPGMLRVEEEGDLLVEALPPAAAAALVERRALDRALELMVLGGWTLLAATLEETRPGAARLLVTPGPARVLVRGRRAFVAPRFVAAAEADRGEPTSFCEVGELALAVAGGVAGSVLTPVPAPVPTPVPTPELVPRLLAAMERLGSSRRSRLAQAVALAGVGAVAVAARDIVAP